MHKQVSPVGRAAWTQVGILSSSCAIGEPYMTGALEVENGHEDISRSSPVQGQPAG
jgi:hypothetical protein